jgi:DNA-binding NarL/FixJ family response regulator
MTGGQQCRVEASGSHSANPWPPGRHQVRLVIGHQYRLFLDSLAAVLAGRGFQIVGTETSEPQLLDSVSQHLPSICLVTVRLAGGGGGLEVLRTIGENHPGIKVVLLAGDSDSGLMQAAIEAGAAGFIPADGHVDNIARALARVYDGGEVFGPSPMGAVVRPFRDAGARNRVWDRLTAREQEVLVRMMDGECTRQIALSLTISVSTARTHIENVLLKLGAHSRLEATVLAARSGIPASYALSMPPRRVAGPR